MPTTPAQACGCPEQPTAHKSGRLSFVARGEQSLGSYDTPSGVRRITFVAVVASSRSNGVQVALEVGARQGLRRGVVKEAGAPKIAAKTTTRSMVESTKNAADFSLGGTPKIFCFSDSEFSPCTSALPPRAIEAGSARGLPSEESDPTGAFRSVWWVGSRSPSDWHEHLECEEARFRFGLCLHAVVPGEKSATCVCARVHAPA